MRWTSLLVSFVVCFNYSYGQWSTKENTILYQEKAYHIRGLNWFGAETDCKVPHGMWVHSMEYYLDMIRDYQFNTIRIPFSYENANQMDAMVKADCVSQAPTLQGKTFRNAMHELIEACRQRKIAVLLDFHTIGGVINEYPGTYQVSEDEVIRTWIHMLNEYTQYPNLLGIDIKNEPHGNIRWPMWGRFVQKCIDRIQRDVPQFQGLYFVEGIQDPNDRSVWGGSFSRMDQYLGNPPFYRIIFSPHVYGISVRGEDAIYDSDDRWNTWFGLLATKFENPICIGEIGGWFDGKDRDWHYKVLSYLQRTNIHNAFYWCLNPNSVDTGGILDFDWTTVIQEKIQFCEQLQPSPTFPIYPHITESL